MVDIDIEQLTASLRSAAQGSLPWTTLTATSYISDEPTPLPITYGTIPTVMASPAFVPAPEYYWTYVDNRLVIIDYVLQRDDRWRVGKLRMFHTMNVEQISELNETMPQPLPDPFTPHDLYISQLTDLEIGGDCGVTLGVAHDNSREGVAERWGLTFKVTDATPAVHPRLAAFYVTVIPMF